MPTYEYGCKSCRKRVSIYQRYQDYGQVPVVCPRCGGAELQRLISRVRLARSSAANLDSMAGDFDENDPRAMARMMRQMGSELGEDLPPEFGEVVDRLEAGEDPEAIEQSLPDFGAPGGADDDWDY